MFKLPELGYSYDSLEPFIDKMTMEIHHTKHHQAYVTGLNDTLDAHPGLMEKPVEYILKIFNSLPENIKNDVRNFGGGHANHSLFWKTIKKNSGTSIEGRLKEMIERDFGSIDKFKAEFETAAKKRFGSGWAWLVLTHQNTLKVMSTANQDSPLMDGFTPILGLDVWEHAYYLHYQNRRPEYVSMFWDIVDWSAVKTNLENAID
ncbi:MAG: superoxide dismutase [Brevinema sp.]